jgi:hypothetical protein
MDRGVILRGVDRKMTHETKEDEGDQWTRVMRCVRCLYRGQASFKVVATKERVKQKLFATSIYYFLENINTGLFLCILCPF